MGGARPPPSVAGESEGEGAAHTHIQRQREERTALRGKALRGLWRPLQGSKAGKKGPVGGRGRSLGPSDPPAVGALTCDTGLGHPLDDGLHGGAAAQRRAGASARKAAAPGNGGRSLPDGAAHSAPWRLGVLTQLPRPGGCGLAVCKAQQRHKRCRQWLPPQDPLQKRGVQGDKPGACRCSSCGRSPFLRRELVPIVSLRTGVGAPTERSGVLYRNGHRGTGEVPIEISDWEKCAGGGGGGLGTRAAHIERWVCRCMGWGKWYKCSCRIWGVWAKGLETARWCLHGLWGHITDTSDGAGRGCPRQGYRDYRQPLQKKGGICRGRGKPLQKVRSACAGSQVSSLQKEA